MEVKAQTLVLIDNSLSVSKVNRDIARYTLEYLFSHTPEGRSYCFMPFSHEFEYAESYTVDYIGLSDMASRLKYENKEISISDVLTDTLDRWQQSDFACRDIVIVTDGNEEQSIYHDKDELYYMLEHTDYPVYIILLDQEDNESAVKGMNAICRLSEGKLFHTEFEGSDAEVERQVSEALLAQMDKYAHSKWGVYENVDNSEEDLGEEAKSETENEEPEDDENEIITDVIEEQTPMDTAFSENVESESMYVLDSNKSVGSPLSYAVIGASFFMAVCGVFLSWCLIQKRKKRISDEEDSYRDIIRQRVEENRECVDVCHGQKDDGSSNSHRYVGETIALVPRKSYPGNDGSTRLLYSGSDVADMTFEDANNPSRYYKITTHGRVTLGRLENCCDVAFEYDDSVSSRHCELFSQDGKWYVKDIGSSNGTFVNGEKVYTELPVESGDLLKMGTLSLIVRY